MIAQQGEIVRAMLRILFIIIRSDCKSCKSKKKKNSEKKVKVTSGA